MVMGSGHEEIKLVHAQRAVPRGPGAGWWMDVNGSLELVADGNVALEVIMRRFQEDGWELLHLSASPDGVSALRFHRKQE